MLGAGKVQQTEFKVKSVQQGRPQTFVYDWFDFALYA